MTKTILDRLRKLDVRPILKVGHYNLTVSWNEDTISAYVDHTRKLLELSYMIDGERISDIFTITTTRCNFGNERHWVLCICGSRVCTLYFHNNHFRCRSCHNLTYKSKREPLRGKKYASLRYLDTAMKIEKIQASSHRRTWNKNLTKKQRKIEKLSHKQISNLDDFNYFESRTRRE